MEKCEYNIGGFCSGRRNAPECDYSLSDECKQFRPDNFKADRLSITIKAKINWEKVCKHILSTYEIDMDELTQHIIDHASYFIDVSADKSDS